MTELEAMRDHILDKGASLVEACEAVDKDSLVREGNLELATHIWQLQQTVCTINRLLGIEDKTCTWT